MFGLLLDGMVDFVLLRMNHMAVFFMFSWFYIVLRERRTGRISRCRSPTPRTLSLSEFFL